MLAVGEVRACLDEAQRADEGIGRQGGEGEQRFEVSMSRNPVVIFDARNHPLRQVATLGHLRLTEPVHLPPALQRVQRVWMALRSRHSDRHNTQSPMACQHFFLSVHEIPLTV